MEHSSAPYFLVAPSREVLDLRAPKSPRAVEQAGKRSGSIGSMLDSADRWVSSKIASVDEPGIRLDIGLPPNEDLLDGHCLHLYGTALSDSLKIATGLQFKSFKLTKSHSQATKLSVSAALPVERPDDEALVTLTTRHSFANPAFAKAIHEHTDAVRDIAFNGQAIKLNISYVTGFPRTWSRLWEPTITGIFGSHTSRHGDGPRSAQIQELGLDHFSIGVQMGHKIQVTISAAPMKFKARRL